MDNLRVEAIMKHHALKKQKTVESEYLCTGLDVYVTVEPSPMDAMALLHSRVARVFYHAHDHISGVLGSNGMLHEAKTINHRYKVYCLQSISIGETDSMKRKKTKNSENNSHTTVKRSKRY